MEKLTKEALLYLDKYFSVLTKLGYIDYSQVDKLIILLFIEDIFNGTLIDFIPDRDYKTLSNCLYCLYGTSCLIPYPEYLDTIITHTNLNKGEFRETEYCNLRYSEQNNIRRV